MTEFPGFDPPYQVQYGIPIPYEDTGDQGVDDYNKFLLYKQFVENYYYSLGRELSMVEKCFGKTKDLDTQYVIPNWRSNSSYTLLTSKRTTWEKWHDFVSLMSLLDRAFWKEGRPLLEISMETKTPTRKLEFIMYANQTLSSLAVKLDEGTKAQVCRYYKTGRYKRVEIARMLGISQGAVATAIRDGYKSGKIRPKSTSK